MDKTDTPGESPVPPNKPLARRAPQPGAPSAGAAAYPESVTRLIDRLARLPGIGRRSAERLTFHILKATAADAMDLSRAIADVKERVRHCRICYNLMDAIAAGVERTDPTSDTCSICSADGRDRGTIMVVEQPKDLIALEHTGSYKGLFHVLMGRISPLEGVSAADLTIADLLARVDDPVRNLGTPVAEVVLALNPTLEGDGTALYLAQELEGMAGRGIRVTRLARGLPTGSQLEFANKSVLADAIQGRRLM